MKSSFAHGENSAPPSHMTAANTVIPVEVNAKFYYGFGGGNSILVITVLSIYLHSDVLLITQE